MDLVNWMTSFSLASEKAKQSRKPLMIYIWSPTCVGCYKMKKDTFPNEKVIETLANNFVLVKINSKEPPPDFNDAIAPYKYNWSPSIIFKSYHGFEVRRIQGFFDPENFDAELSVTLALNHLYLHNYSDAVNYFSEVIENYEGCEVIPEAMYWKGVSTYQKEKNLSVLLPEWNMLRKKFPESIWAMKANLIFEIEDILNGKTILE